MILWKLILYLNSMVAFKYHDTQNHCVFSVSIHPIRVICGTVCIQILETSLDDRLPDKNNKSNITIMNCTIVVLSFRGFCLTDLELVKDLEDVYEGYRNTGGYNLLSTYSF